MASIADVNLKLMSASALLDADPSAAVRAAGEILENNPDHAAASLLLATAARKLGNTALALELLEGLVRSQPAAGPIRLELARTYREAGRDAESVAALREALSLEPALADGWRELSSQLAALGDARGADAAYERYAATASQPWQLAEPSAALAANRVAAAEAMLRRILRETPQDVAAIRMLADALARREAYAEAERLLCQALELAPGCSAARHDLACLLLTQQKAADILPLVERLLLLDPQNAVYRDLLASVFSMTGQHTQAMETLGALAAEPNAGYAEWLNYGLELKTAGRTHESIAAYRRAMALEPAKGATYWSLANLKTFRFDAAEIDAMRSALQRQDLKPDDRVELEFALGKVREDERRFAESFEHYAAGNALRRKGVNYDAGKISLHVRRSQEIYTPQFFAERAHFGSQAQDPIFIVGLPRAGSTLLEQILASHSRVEGTRELAEMVAIARGLATKNGEADESRALEALCSLDAAQVAALADRYLAETRIYRRRGAPRFIDKMPNNFLHIGLIHLMFPRAAIIDARRHPLGGCFSAFKQHFAAGQLFTYDQADLARFYRDYVELMAHYDAVLPGRIHRVHYERVVADLSGEVHRLLEYCGLPFEDQCLRFHETRRGVQTASSEQVRQPIYAQGVDQWRHFEPWLGPLKEALGDLAEHYPESPGRDE
ncbi:MAG TPA: sulfotransferase [Steroidobacteraceae bacterium]|nr:sulfotransferase [Steroidobacteraceae bacterium]